MGDWSIACCCTKSNALEQHRFALQIHSKTCYICCCSDFDARRLRFRVTLLGIFAVVLRSKLIHNVELS